MNKRQFLKGLLASAAAATVTIKTERELHRHIYDRPTVQTEGFGLAPLKAEGTSVPYDPVVPPYSFTDDPDVGPEP